MSSQKKTATAFTLVEVLLTMGIIVLGMLPVLALLTIAVREQGGANQESVASIIAQGVYSDLRRSRGDMGGILYRHSSTFDLGNPASDPDGDFSVQSLGVSPGDVYIVYGLMESAAGSNDWIHTPLEEITASDYTDGSSNINGTHIVRIHYEDQAAGITHQSTAGTSAGADVFKPRLYEVTVSIEQPSNAPAANRRSLDFKAYMTLSDRR
jgi:type II secretory pathway pseudopilin PulG